MVTFFVSGNRLTGDITSSIQFLHLDNNNFIGRLEMTRPSEILIQNNYIFDIFVNDLTVLTACNISSNALLGNPFVASLTMCSQTGLFSRMLTSFSTSLSVKTTKSTILSETTKKSLSKSKITTSSSRTPTQSIITVIFTTSSQSETSTVTIQTIEQSILRTTPQKILQTTKNIAIDSLNSQSKSKTSSRLNSVSLELKAWSHDATVILFWDNLSTIQVVMKLARLCVDLGVLYQKISIESMEKNNQNMSTLNPITNRKALINCIYLFFYNPLTIFIFH